MIALVESEREGCGCARTHQEATAGEGRLSDEKTGYGGQNSAKWLHHDPEGMIVFLSFYLFFYWLLAVLFYTL